MYMYLNKRRSHKGHVAGSTTQEFLQGLRFQPRAHYQPLVVLVQHGRFLRLCGRENIGILGFWHASKYKLYKLHQKCILKLFD